MDESLSAFKNHGFDYMVYDCIHRYMIAFFQFSINIYKLSADSDLAPPALSSLQHRPT